MVSLKLFLILSTFHLSHGGILLSTLSAYYNKIMGIPPAPTEEYQQYLRDRVFIRLAISRRNIEEMKIILNSGFDVNNIVDDDGNSIAHLAAESGNTEIMDFLKQRGAVWTKKNYAGDSLMEIAVSSGHYNMVRYLETYCEGKIYPDEGEMGTFLHTMGITEPIVRYFISKGLDVNALDSNGTTALLVQLESRADIGVIRALVENGAEIHFEHAKTKNTALHVAAKTGNVDAVKFLLEKGADFTKINSDGETPSMVAEGEMMLKGESDELRAIEEALETKQKEMEAKAPVHQKEANENAETEEYEDAEDTSGSSETKQSVDKA